MTNSSSSNSSGDNDESVSGSLLVLARTRRDKGARCHERMKKTEGWREGEDEEEPEGSLRRESEKEGEVR